MQISLTHRPETQENHENPLEENQIDLQLPKPQPHHEELEQERIVQQQAQSAQQAGSNNNKRKAIEQQGIPPETDRTRPRYSDIATVV